MSSSIIKDLGEHPEDKKPVRIMKGQYGPYIKYKSLNATIPKKELFIGKKCTYAVKYLRETNFNKSKCKISKELSKVFEKMGSGD